MNVIVKLNQGLGETMGPNFALTANSGSVVPSTATTEQLLTGILCVVSDSATTVTVTSQGTCTNSLILNISSGRTTTTTSTSTSTSTTTLPPTTTTTSTSTSTSTTSTSTSTSTSTTSTSTSTTTKPPFNFSISYFCADAPTYATSVSGTSPVYGTPPYFFGTNVFTSESAALANTSWSQVNSATYDTNSQNGFYYIAAKDSEGTVKVNNVQQICQFPGISYTGYCSTTLSNTCAGTNANYPFGFNVQAPSTFANTTKISASFYNYAEFIVGATIYVRVLNTTQYKIFVVQNGRGEALGDGILYNC